MISPRAKRYPAPEEGPGGEFKPGSSQALIVGMVGYGKRVLEFGCAAGYTARQLSARGNRVTGVDADADALAEAGRSCEETILADLDLRPLGEILGDRRFDVVVFGDVLEHLRDPLRVLRESRSFLSEDGFAVVSIPNVAHGNVRLSLLRGSFDYAPVGLLDNSHLRFFTLRSVRELCTRAGYRIETIERTKVALFEQSAVVPQVDEREFSPDLIDEIRGDREHDTLQFVLRALPVADDEHLSLALDELAGAEARAAEAGATVERLERRLAVAEAAAEQAAAQAALAARESDGRDEALREAAAQTERLREELFDASRALGEASALHAAAERAHAELATRHEALRAELAERDVELGRLRLAAAAAEAKLAELEGSRAERERELTELVDERGSALARLAHEHAATLAVVRQSERRSADALAELRAELETAVAQREAALGELGDALAEARSAGEALAARLAQAEARGLTRERELVQIAEERSAALVTLAREHAAALAANRAARAEAGDALADLQARLAAHEAARRQAEAARDAALERLAEAEEAALAREASLHEAAELPALLHEARERSVTLEKRLAESEGALEELWAFIAGRERELVAENERLAAERDALEVERDALEVERGALEGERDALVSEREALAARPDPDFLETIEARERDLTAALRALTEERAALAERLAEAQDAAIARETSMAEAFAEHAERDAARAAVIAKLDAELRDVKAAYAATAEAFKAHVEAEVRLLRAEGAHIDGTIRAIQQSWAWSLKTFLLRARRRLPGGRSRL